MKILVLFLMLAYALAGDDVSRKYVAYLQHLPTKTKKYRFFKLVLPPVQEVDAQLRKLYLDTLYAIKHGTKKKRIHRLMQEYKTQDPLELLKRIKPHPISITLAQAAIESAWGTSRFFVEANNIFGMWSKSNAPQSAIKAAKNRKGGKAIFLKRYKTLRDSVAAYYKNIATNRAYKCFRQARYFSDDPYELVAYLHRYSEKKELYPVELIKIIKHNNLTKYDVKKPLPRYKKYN